MAGLWGEPKVGKGRDGGGLGRNEHGKREGKGDKRGWWCIKRWLITTLKVITLWPLR